MAKDNENTYLAVLGLCVRTLINIVFIFLLVEGYIYAYHFSYMLFADLPAVAASESVVNITISEGSSAKDVGFLLENSGVVEDQYQFLARVYLGRYHTKIKAGTYSLGPAMTPDEICRIICGIKNEGAS